MCRLLVWAPVASGPLPLLTPPPHAPHPSTPSSLPSVHLPHGVSMAGQRPCPLAFHCLAHHHDGLPDAAQLRLQLTPPGGKGRGGQQEGKWVVMVGWGWGGQRSKESGRGKGKGVGGWG